MNLYSDKFTGNFVNGSFERCRHGYSVFGDCARCGMFHPIRYIRNVFWKLSNG